MNDFDSKYAWSTDSKRLLFCAATMLVLWTCSPASSRQTDSAPDPSADSKNATGIVSSAPSQAQPTRKKTAKTVQYCGNTTTAGDIWIRGAHIHGAAHFASKVFRFPVMVFGGTSKPLFMHLRKDDAAAAMKSLAEAAGMRALWAKQGWVLVPRIFKRGADVERRLTGVPVSRGRSAQWTLYLTGADTLLDVLVVSHDRVDPAALAAADISVFGELKKEELLHILRIVSGGTLKREGGRWVAGGDWFFPSGTVPPHPLPNVACDAVPLRDVVLPHTPVSTLKVLATEVGDSPLALLYSTAPTCGPATAVVREHTFVGAAVEENCGYEQCNYQVHRIRRDQVSLTLDSGRCDVQLQMKELSLPKCVSP